MVEVERHHRVVRGLTAELFNDAVDKAEKQGWNLYPETVEERVTLEWSGVMWKWTDGAKNLDKLINSTMKAMATR